MEYCAATADPPALLAYANPQDHSEQNIKTKNKKNKKTENKTKHIHGRNLLGLTWHSPQRERLIK